VGVEDVVSLALDHTAGGARVELDVPETLPSVLADPGLLERVIANLIENALRYSPAERAIRVAASAHGDAVELRVIDNGPGIPPSERETVFAPFQRREDHATDSAGVGLGLAVARGFIEAMHGTLTLEDTPGGGLMAVVTLPVSGSEVLA
jgi:two-component system sensor histidine kinase KdpD